MTDDSEVHDVDDVQESSGMTALIMAGERIVAVENEQLRMIARETPRNVAVCFDQSLAELNIMPEIAEKMFYSIPYKKWDPILKKEIEQDVEGLSIKASMLLIRYWGYCSNRTDVIASDAKEVIVQGTIVDLQTGVRTVRTVRCPKVVWSKKNNREIALRADKLQMAVQAAASKAVRNAILAYMPEPMKFKLLEHAKYLVEQGVTSGAPKGTPLDKRVAKMVGSFASLGVTASQIETFIGHGIDEITPSEYSRLVGIGTAIHDGYAKVEDVFTMDEVKAEKPPTPGELSPEDIKNAATIDLVTERLDKKRPAEDQTGPPIEVDIPGIEF